ncbi:MAG: isopenicillin N synthase-like dioxygenase [Phenylobacterium sp.]
MTFDFNDEIQGMNTLELETISLIDFSNTAKRDVIASQLNHAVTSHGMFAITDHGVKPALLAQCFKLSRDFFSLPAEDKNAIPIEGMLPPRGYFPDGVYVKNSQKFPLATAVRENFVYCIANNTDKQPSDLANQFFTPITWPDKIDGFQRCFTEFQTAMHQLTQTLWSLFAVALNLPADYFVPLTTNPTSFTVINYYKHVESWTSHYGDFRMGPHTDITTYTVIMAEESEHSLQVELVSGEWVNISAPDGSIVIQIGDIMNRWTSDKWRSTKHRVLPPIQSSTDNSRVSVVYGVQTDIGVEISSLPDCQDKGMTNEPITCCEHELASFTKALEFSAG